MNKHEAAAGFATKNGLLRDAWQGLRYLGDSWHPVAL
jgi:hypothetical protein